MPFVRTPTEIETFKRFLKCIKKTWVKKTSKSKEAEACLDTLSWLEGGSGGRIENSLAIFSLLESAFPEEAKEFLKETGTVGA